MTWTAKAAQRIKEALLYFMHQDPNLSGLVETMDRNVHEEYITTIIEAYAEPLITLLHEARRRHDAMCPAYADLRPCHCGADEWNKQIDKILS
jgi:hypothetical protein